MREIYARCPKRGMASSRRKQTRHIAALDCSRPRRSDAEAASLAGSSPRASSANLPDLPTRIQPARTRSRGSRGIRRNSAPKRTFAAIADARARARYPNASTVPSAGGRAHPSGCTQTSGQTNNDPSGRIRAYLRERLSDATVGNASVSWRFVSRLTRQKNVSPPKSSLELWDKSRRCRFVADRPERDVSAMSPAGTSRDIGSSDRGEFGRASGDARFE